MEDLFQILFILIFIISSIVSSLKKKKKKTKKPVQTPTQRPAQKVQKAQPVSTNKKQKTSAEILEEMLGLKVNIPEPQKREAPVYSEDNIEPKTWDPVAEFEVEEQGKKISTDYREKSSAKKEEFEKDSQKHRAFLEEKINVERVFKKPSYAKRLIKKNKNLKEYIIIQEILNKPKALRR